MLLGILCIADDDDDEDDDDDTKRRLANCSATWGATASAVAVAAAVDVVLGEYRKNLTYWASRTNGTIRSTRYCTCRTKACLR